MASYKEGQVHQLVESLEENEFTAADIAALGQNFNGVLLDLKLLLMSLATIVRICFKLALDKALNPAEFFGKGWAFWKGPADDNGLEGDEDCVEEPEVVDLEQILLETHLKKDETCLHGEEKMKRARASKNRQLGAKTFLALWNNWKECNKAGKPGDSILERLHKSRKIGNVIYFFGSSLRCPDGSRGVLYLYRSTEWFQRFSRLDVRWYANRPSVALKGVS